MSAFLLNPYRHGGGDPVPDYIGQWGFEEGTGTTVADGSSNGNDGTATSGMPWRDGVIGDYSGDMNGNKLVDCGDDDIFSFGDGSTDSPFSASCWVKFNSFASSGGIIGKATGSSVGEWYLLMASSLFFRLVDDSTGGYIGVTEGSNPMAVDTWYHIAVTYDGSGTTGGMKIYRDGVEVSTSTSSSGSYTAMENTAVSQYLGYRGNYLDGVLDECRLYDRELSVSEVEALYREV